jgi:hypothetical protein
LSDLASLNISSWVLLVFCWSFAGLLLAGASWCWLVLAGAGWCWTLLDTYVLGPWRHPQIEKR